MFHAFNTAWSIHVILDLQELCIDNIKLHQQILNQMQENVVILYSFPPMHKNVDFYEKKVDNVSGIEVIRIFNYPELDFKQFSTHTYGRVGKELLGTA